MTVLLEVPGVALAMSPEHGATITSLRDTLAHREWTEQPRADLADVDPVLSIEPTNGVGDSLQRCVQRSPIALTPGHTTRTWSISIQLANRTFVGFESPHHE